LKEESTKKNELERTSLSDSEVIGLSIGHRGKSNVQVLDVKSSDFLIQMLGEDAEKGHAVVSGDAIKWTADLRTY
jgi:hypothetical protein